MKLARSLIGVVVANEPFAAEYFHNLSPPFQGSPVTLRPDRHAQSPAIAVGVAKNICKILGCVIKIFHFPSQKPPGVAPFKKIFNSRERFAGETAH